jgi:hypothetical protein
VKEEVQAKISHVETAMAVKVSALWRYLSAVSKLTLSSLVACPFLQMDRKIDKFEKKLDTKPELKRKMAAAAGSSGGGGGDWKLPFFFLLVLIVGASGVMLYFYQRILRKMHLP